MPDFLKRWFGTRDEETVRPRAPDGHRIYSIGDIHGRLDLLEDLQRQIREDSESYAGEKSLVYLGDYIDRGEQSKEVIDLLLDQPMDGFQTIFLRGNHEQTLLDFLRHPRAVASWLTYGGVATLNSYGVVPHLEAHMEELEHLRNELEHRLPENHLAFYRNLEMMHLAGTYCFVHAGIRPGIPLEKQKPEDLLWIRDDFTRDSSRHGHIVVHGHSITNEVDWQANRIGIDTGAFHTGVLTCLVLEGEEQRLLQTGQPD